MGILKSSTMKASLARTHPRRRHFRQGTDEAFKDGSEKADLASGYCIFVLRNQHVSPMKLFFCDLVLRYFVVRFCYTVEAEKESMLHQPLEQSFPLTAGAVEKYSYPL